MLQNGEDDDTRLAREKGDDILSTVHDLRKGGHAAFGFEKKDNPGSRLSNIILL